MIKRGRGEERKTMERGRGKQGKKGREEGTERRGREDDKERIRKRLTDKGLEMEGKRVNRVKKNFFKNGRKRNEKKTLEEGGGIR